MNKNYYNYVGLLIFSYGAIGFFNPLLGQYLHSISFSGTQIGIITSLATTVGIFASPFWGAMYHKDQRWFGTRIMLLLSIAAASLMLILMPIRQSFLFLIVYSIISFFQMPIMPLCDAVVLDSDHGFGAIRKWGAVGYGSAVLIAGQLAESVGLEIIFPLYSVAFLIMAIFTIRIFKTHKLNMGIALQTKKEENKEPNTHIGFRQLFANKKFMLLLLSAFFVCGTNVANNTYFGFLYTSGGGSLAGIGVALLLMVGSEVPFMACIEKISARFTLEKMILIAMCISVARFIFYGMAPPYYLLIITFFLQGMVNGTILVEFVKYIAKMVDDRATGMAMTLYQAVSSSASSIVCQFWGGVILDAYNAAGVYLFFGIFNLVGVVIYVACGLYKPYKG